MTVSTVLEKPRYSIKTPTNISSRIQWLRDYYFQGVKRAWNNEYTSWTTGEPWDFQYDELTFYIVPETYAFLQTFRSSFVQSARRVDLHPDFWKWSLPERRAWFNREVMVKHLPREVLPGDLIAGARSTSRPPPASPKKRPKPATSRSLVQRARALPCSGSTTMVTATPAATSGHLIPDYGRILREGWKAVHAGLEAAYEKLSPADQRGKRGGQLRAMLTAASMPRDLAAAYSVECTRLAGIGAGPRT